MFRPFLNSLMLGSLFFPFIAIAGSTAQVASVKVQYIDKQKKLAVMNIEYN